MVVVVFLLLERKCFFFLFPRSGPGRIDRDGQCEERDERDERDQGQKLVVAVDEFPVALHTSTGRVTSRDQQPLCLRIRKTGDDKLDTTAPLSAAAVPTHKVCTAGLLQAAAATTDSILCSTSSVEKYNEDDRGGPG